LDEFFLKTSGATGFHISVAARAPIYIRAGRECSLKIVARVVEAKLPKAGYAPAIDSKKTSEGKRFFD